MAMSGRGQAPFTAPRTASNSDPDPCGGYDYEFVDEVPHKYICTICTKVLRKARLAECCGTHYCDWCLAQWLTRNWQGGCPHCRAVQFQNVLNKKKIREINDLRIRCTHHQSGCKWIGELGILINHLDRGCGYVMVMCTNKAYHVHDGHVTCKAEIERRCLTKHWESVCKYPPYKCEYCPHVDTYDGIAGSGLAKNTRSRIICLPKNHHQTCDHFPLAYENICGEVNIKRKDMPSHRNVCSLEVLKCPFDDYCNKHILRRDMENHKEQCDFRPYSCEYCGHRGTFLLIIGKGKFWTLEKSHYEKCEHYPLECVNKCREKNIKRKEMNTHRNNCPLEPLECPLGKHVSGNKILRKDMEKQTSEECEFRPYTCQHCNLAGTYISITGKGESSQKKKCHYEVCANYPLCCPNKCQAKNIKHKHMPLHRSQCPLEPLKYANCTDHILRKDMDSHCKENMQNHLLLMAKSHQRKNEELSHKIDELTQKLAKFDAPPPDDYYDERDDYDDYDNYDSKY